MKSNSLKFDEYLNTSLSLSLSRCVLNLIESKCLKTLFFDNNIYIYIQQQKSKIVAQIHNSIAYIANKE